MSVYTSRLKSPLFNLVKNGTKTIEMRLMDEKRSQFKVGDILIFKKLPDEIETVKKILKEEMESVVNLKVKLDVDVELGSTWDLK